MYVTASPFFLFRVLNERKKSDFTNVSEKTTTQAHVKQNYKWDDIRMICRFRKKPINQTTQNFPFFRQITALSYYILLKRGAFVDPHEIESIKPS